MERITPELARFFRNAEKPLFDIYIKDNRIPSTDEFLKFKIKEKHINSFLGLYVYKWWVLSLRLKDQTADSNLDVLALEDKIDFPTDKYFYQLGVPYLNVNELKHQLLKTKNKVFAINKYTGWPTGGYSYREIQKYFSMWKSSPFYNFRSTDDVVLHIPDLKEFVGRLHRGEINKIFKEKQESNFYSPSSQSMMAKFCNEIYIEKLIDEMSDSKPWIAITENGRFLNGFSTRDKLIHHYSQDIHSLFQSVHSDFDNGVPTMDKRPLSFDDCRDFSDWFFFKIPNIETAIKGFRIGDYKALDQIQNVESFKDYFISNCSDIQCVYNHDCTTLMTKYRS